MELYWSRLTKPDFNVFFIVIYRNKQAGWFFICKLILIKIEETSRKKLDSFWGHLLNLYIKVFFIAITQIKHARGLVLVCNLILTKLKDMLRKIWKCCQGNLPIPNFKVFFKAISRINQARKLIFGMLLDSNLNRKNIAIYNRAQVFV